MRSRKHTGAGLTPPTLDRLRPVADRVDALTRDSGRAVLEGDPTIAMALLADDGARDRCESALQAAWSDVLGRAPFLHPDQALAVDLLVSLERITQLATTICREMVRLGEDTQIADVPSLQRLAEMVPEMLGDALGAVRENDRPSAERVVDRSLKVDMCFAQAHSDLLQVARRDELDLTIAKKLHAVGRALERIGDSASEIAESVRRVALVQA